MKPAPFDYARADCADEACALLQEVGSDARLLAGGQSLLPRLNLRIERPAVVIDLSRCADLQSLQWDDTGLHVGAMVTQARLLAHVSQALGGDPVPLLGQALPHVANPQVRARGTVGGSLAFADPTAELPLCLVAMDGALLLRSERGTRRVGATEFFLGAGHTACRPDELLIASLWPRWHGAVGWAFDEVAMRPGGQATVTLAARATATELCLAVGGLCDRPLCWRAAADAATDPRELGAALADWLRTLAVRDDGLVGARYRCHVVGHVGPQLLRQALSRRAAAPMGGKERT